MLADAYNNAMRLLGLGQIESAVSHLEDLVARFPDFLDAHNSLGVALKHQGKFADARRCFEHVIARRPNHDSATNNLATILITTGDFEAAEQVLRLAIARTRMNAKPYGNLASVYEKQSRIPEAIATAQAGSSIDPADALCRLVQARCLRRSGRLDEAWNAIRDAKPQASDICDNLSIGLLFEQGVILDQLNRTDEAFQRFQSANHAGRATFSQAGTSANRYLTEVEHLSDLVQWYESPSGESSADESSADESSPVFLIGFPRSGTTLLGKILNAHPQCMTLEERPTLSGLLHQVSSLPNGYPAELLTLEDEDRLNLQRAYWADVEECLPEQSRDDRVPDGRVLIDQHPFNTSRVWPIAAAFPNARFIVALRDPRDVCLSCFMQNFNPNDVTANFCSLEDTARAYCNTMQNWIEASRRIQPRTITIRYEDVVHNFEPTVARMLDFVGVKWDESVRDFWKESRHQTVCTTASYHQVTQPLYDRAVGRWKNYQKQLDGIQDQLAPFVNEFGYEPADVLKVAG